MKRVTILTLAIFFAFGAIFYFSHPAKDSLFQKDATFTPEADLNSQTQVLNLNGYRITVSRDRQGSDTLTISRNRRQLYRETSRRFMLRHVSAEGNSRWDDLIVPGRNITGGSEPNLVVGDWSGGAHCCTTYRVFSLGSNMKLLATIKALDDENAHFAELTGDTIPEFVLRDYNFAYAWGSFVESPAPKVVLRYTKGGYHPSPELMRRPRPSEKAFEELVRECRKAWTPGSANVPVMVRESMIDLIYAGHTELAERLSRETWPASGPEMGAFLEDLYRTLSTSPYYRELPWRKGS